MHAVLKVIASVATSIAVYFLVNHAGAWLRGREAAAIGQEHAQKLLAQAADEGREGSFAESLYRASIAEQKKLLQSAPNDRARQAVAAVGLTGYAFAHTESRPDICRRHGVEIEPFVAAFKQRHESALTTARRIIEAQRIPLAQLHASLKEPLESVLERALQSEAAQVGLRVEDVCQLYASNPTLFAAELDYAVLQPDAYLVLLGAD